jgi:hypothetical protein
MAQTIEEKNEKQRVRGKIYRKEMSPEMKAKVAEGKKANALKNKEKKVADRAAYYQKNKETMNANSKAYHQKVRDEIAAKKAVVVYAPRIRKVANQPANTTTLKDEAKKMGITTAHLRTIQKDIRFNMPKVKMLRMDGMDLFDIYELAAWQQQYREVLAQEAISGASKKNIGEIRLTPHVMLLINWLQASKHVTKYCNTQRVAINSNQFWARWA